MHITLQLHFPSNKYLVVQIENDRVCGVMNDTLYRLGIRSYKSAFMYAVKIDLSIL